MLTSSGAPKHRERRASERHSCRPETSCHVIDLLTESLAEGTPWNASLGGVCVLIEPHYLPGKHLEVELCGRGDGTSIHAFAEVVHALEVPSFREMWLTGCSFGGEAFAEEQLQPYV
jgi:hypothetical protein